MSDSSLSDPPLSEGALEQALRRAVQLVYSRGDLESLTVKRIRKAAEEDLDLHVDFFKRHPEWEGKSKRIIKDEAVRLDPHVSQYLQLTEPPLPGSPSYRRRE